jgi:hypothetical protein
MEFKIRCSAIGQIMTAPRTKGAALSETAKTYCETWLKEQLYDRRAEVNTVQMRKGNAVEAAAIDFAQAIMEPGGLWFKNETSFADDWMKGTPDLLIGSAVYDIKSPWSWETFPLFDTEPDKAYYWQLQGYMALTKSTEAAVLYCLMNAPDEFIMDEARRMSYARGLGGNTDDTWADAMRKMTYEDVPTNLRFKMFFVGRDDAAILSIRDKVEACREYIQELKERL